ncbi:MAG: Asp-tRNA(Asn)/Glu-tRNA(Gln) amidotransferase subunit GatA [Planctomycetota bacterium]
MSGITELSALELRDAIAAGGVSAVEATRAYLQSLEKCEPQVQSFNEVFADRALDKAEKIDADRRAGRKLGPLAGVPMAIKDNMCTTYGRTTCSSRILADYKAPYTATAVKKIEDAGAIVIGKTNMDEFAMGSSTEHSAFKPTHNPWDTGRVPGGSSGGSAAAVAARQCTAALGSDTGGSIRQPASFCGVVGFKPTYGRVSRYGLVAFGSSLDQIGPLTQDVRDCALVTGVIAGYDPKDSTSVPQEVEDYPTTVDRPVENLRVGVPKEFYSDALDAEINSALRKATDIFSSLGAEVLEVSLPHSRIERDENGSLSSYAVACYYIVAMAEASSNLARYDGVHYGHRTAEKTDDIVDMYSRTRAEGFGDEVKRRIMLGTYTLSAGYYDAYYNKALKVRRLIANDFKAAFEACDVLLCPISPTPAFRLGEKTADPLQMYLADIYTLSLNLAGLPGISVPAGLSKASLPIGMQLIGPAMSEEKILRAARMYEAASGVARLRPKVAGA